MAYESTVSYWNIPDSIATSLGVLALCLTLVPFFSGSKLGPLEIPRIARSRRRLSGLIGLFLLLLVLIAYWPLWAIAPITFSQCGFFSDDYATAKQWRNYDRRDSGKRLWVACQIQAHEDLDISSVETAEGVSDWLFAGYTSQQRSQSVHLSKDTSTRLAVVIEPQPGDAHLRPFETPSTFCVYRGDGGSPLRARLPALSLR